MKNFLMVNAMRAIIAALAIAIAPTVAFADQIGISGAIGTITFENTATGITFSTAGFDALGTANFQRPTGIIRAIGDAAFGPESGHLGAESSGFFPVITSALQPFDFAAGPDFVDGKIVWAGIKDNTLDPQFDVGSLFQIAAAGGTSDFLGDFHSGLNVLADLTIVVPETLDDLSHQAYGTEITGTFSTAEFFGTPVPEPANSLILLLGAIAMLALSRIPFSRKPPAAAANAAG